MPEQYILAWVDEIIMGPQVRAALGCCPRPRPPPVPHPVATRAWQAGEHRTMGEEGRGNKLPTSDMHSEYMVHGSTASSCGRRATRTASSTHTGSRWPRCSRTSARRRSRRTCTLPGPGRGILPAGAPGVPRGRRERQRREQRHERLRLTSMSRNLGISRASYPKRSWDTL